MGAGASGSGMLVWAADALGVRGLRTRFSAVSPDTGVLSDKRNSSRLRASAVRGRDLGSGWSVKTEGYGA